MKNIRIIIGLYALLGFALHAHAYTVEWAVAPEDIRLSFFRRGYYYYTDNVESRIGLMDVNGNIIYERSDLDNMNFEYMGDNITLITTDQDMGHRIIGMLNREQKFIPIPYRIYIKDKYFTDGDIIGVQDSIGRVGYLNLEGSLVVKCQFRQGMPFREGWALVLDENDEWKYINKDWDKTHKPLKIDGGKILEGRQFIHGNTYVRQKKKWKRINTKGKETTERMGIKANIEADVSYHTEEFIYHSQRQENPERYRKQTPADPCGVFIDESNEHLIGYKQDGEWFVPPQFDAFMRENFDSTYVKVTQRITDDYELMGLLHKLEGDFATISADSLLRRRSSDVFKASFSYPPTVDASKLHVMIIGSNGIPVPASSLTFDNGVCRFTYTPTSDETSQNDKDLELVYQVYADHNLLLWEKNITVSLIDAKKATIGSIKQNRTTADGKQIVWVNVNNPAGNAPLKATFTITDTQGREIGTVTQDVRPGDNRRLKLNVGVGSAFQAKATVTLNNGQPPRSELLLMTPFKKNYKESAPVRAIIEQPKPKRVPWR